jgi:hypothetical protein
MSDALTIALNVVNNAPSQYTNMPFESVVEFGGRALFFGASGVFEETGSTDDGTEIEAWIDTPAYDFARREQKSVEGISVGGEFADGVYVTVYMDEDTEHSRTYTADPVKAGQVQQDVVWTLKKYRYGKGRYCHVRIGNVDGGDFSVDYLGLAPVFYTRRPRRM